jgi:hypothetical protein
LGDLLPELGAGKILPIRAGDNEATPRPKTGTPPPDEITPAERGFVGTKKDDRSSRFADAAWRAPWRFLISGPLKDWRPGIDRDVQLLAEQQHRPGRQVADYAIDALDACLAQGLGHVRRRRACHDHVLRKSGVERNCHGITIRRDSLALYPPHGARIGVRAQRGFDR